MSNEIIWGLQSMHTIHSWKGTTTWKSESQMKLFELFSQEEAEHLVQLILKWKDQSPAWPTMTTMMATIRQTGISFSYRPGLIEILFPKCKSYKDTLHSCWYYQQAWSHSYQPRNWCLTEANIAIGLLFSISTISQIKRCCELCF